MKGSLEGGFNKWILDTIKIFDTCIKPILLYGSDFWGCLKVPSNDPIEKMHLRFCKELLGVQRKTTSKGIYLELGRVPLSIYANRAAIKNWVRIKAGKASSLLIASTEQAEKEKFPWTERIKSCLSVNGVGYLHNDRKIKNLHKTIVARQTDIFSQESLNLIINPE